MTTLLVASGGGHLQQLLALLPRMRLPGHVAWAVPESGLSGDRLASEDCHLIPHYPARDWRGAIRLTRTARSILRSTGAERIISTGAHPAPPFFLVGATMGMDLHYIESATRTDGPSLSGRLVAKLPSTHLYTQYPHLAHGRWHFAGSVFDPFQPINRKQAVTDIRKVVVSLGTEMVGFRRAVETLLAILPSGADILWQTGATDVSGLAIAGRPSVPASELREAIVESDVFISHAGTGSALTAFELGKYPVLLPRESRFGEHVDDHQMLTARELTRRGLALAVPVDELTAQHLRRAASVEVVADSTFRPFDLVGVGTGDS